MQTNLGKSITINENVTETNQKILTQAIEEYNNQATYSGGCSGFVDSVLKGVKIMNNYTPNSDIWYNHIDTVSAQLKDGYKIQLIAENKNYVPDDNGNDIDWAKALNAELMPGDIICGQAAETDKDGNITKHLGGHMAIFLGNAKDLTTLNSKKYINPDLKRKDVGGTENGNWLVYAPDVNTNPRINAYSLLFRSNTNTKKKCNKLRVYRIVKAKTDETTYSLRLRKNGGTLSAKFKVNGTTITTDDKGNFTTVTGLSNTDKNGNIKVNSIRTDEYEIYESVQPKGYVNNWERAMTLKVETAEIDGKYQISKMYVERTGIVNKSHVIEPGTTSYYPFGTNGGLIINSHRVGKDSAGNYNSVGVIEMYFTDNEEPPVNNTYNISLTKIDENGCTVPNAFFDTTYEYINPAKHFSQMDAAKAGEDTKANYLFYVTGKAKLNDYHHGPLKSATVSSGGKIPISPIIASSSNALGIEAAAKSYNYPNLIFLDEYGNTLNNCKFENDEFLIEDRYTFKEKKLAGYIQDTNKYEIIVTKAYSVNGSTSGKYKGYIKRVVVNRNGYEIIKRTYKVTGEFDTINSFGPPGDSNVHITIDGSGKDIDNVKINVTLENRKITGSYNLYVGKKSSYNDYLQDANHVTQEIKREDNLAGAKFLVEIQSNGASQQYSQIITSIDGYWNEGNNIPINITNTYKDYIHIKELSPPDGYSTGEITEIWMQVYKKEENNKYVVDYVTYDFGKDGKGRYSKRKYARICIIRKSDWTQCRIYEIK